MTAIRPATDRMAQALVNGRPRGLFAAIEHPDGTAYFSTGVGSRSWNGQTWRGTGQLGSVSPIKQSSELAVQDISFRLAGCDLEVVEQLNDDLRNLRGQVWLYCLDYDDSVIADPIQLLDCELDFQTYTLADDGTATIEIVAHSGFYTLNRSVEEAWTPENQRLAYPTDTGLDMIPSLQHQDLQWTP